MAPTRGVIALALALLCVVGWLQHARAAEPGPADTIKALYASYGLGLDSDKTGFNEAVGKRLADQRLGVRYRPVIVRSRKVLALSWPSPGIVLAWPCSCFACPHRRLRL